MIKIKQFLLYALLLFLKQLHGGWPGLPILDQWAFILTIFMGTRLGGLNNYHKTHYLSSAKP